MKNQETGGQAYPLSVAGDYGSYNGPNGMTLLDHFAGQVLPAIVGNNKLLDQLTKAQPQTGMIDVVTDAAYAFARSMIRTRKL